MLSSIRSRDATAILLQVGVSEFVFQEKQMISGLNMPYYPYGMKREGTAIMRPYGTMFSSDVFRDSITEIIDGNLVVWGDQVWGETQDYRVTIKNAAC